VPSFFSAIVPSEVSGFVPEVPTNVRSTVHTQFFRPSFLLSFVVGGLKRLYLLYPERALKVCTQIFPVEEV